VIKRISEKSGNSSTIKAIYKKRYGEKKLKKLLGKDLGFGLNILHISINQSTKTYEELWMYMEKSFGSETLKTMSTKHCDYIESGGLIFNELFSMGGTGGIPPVVESFITRTCTSEVSEENFHFWNLAAKFSTLEFIQRITKLVEENEIIAESFFKELSKFRNMANRGILDYARGNSNQKEIDYKRGDGRSLLIEHFDRKFSE
jgi:hypothetical protein